MNDIKTNESHLEELANELADTEINFSISNNYSTGKSMDKIDFHASDGGLLDRKPPMG